jgi:hypothetical protein
MSRPIHALVLAALVLLLQSTASNAQTRSEQPSISSFFFTLPARDDDARLSKGDRDDGGQLSERDRDKDKDKDKDKDHHHHHHSPSDPDDD